jgi:peptidoglycan/LPS O-acetylase OafA/YrhL
VSTTTDSTPLEFTADEHPKTRNLALDGLRAFAVASVLAFHGGLNHFHGGFLGVDVFFALSGFLITSLLISEFDGRSKISLGRFYLRRAKRLLPALLLVIVAVCVVTMWVSPPGLFPGLYSDVLAAFFYFSNWHLMGGSSNYFTLLSPPSPLTHTWSLAIEEQFYIVWPLIVLGVLRLRHRVSTLGALAATGAVASAALMFYGHQHGWSVDRLYYGTDTHAEGLLLGAATACALFAYRKRPPSTSGCDLTTYLKYAGPIAMIAGLLIMQRAHGSSGWMFEGGFLAMALCSSVSVAYLVTWPTTYVARALAWRPLVYVGQISYGIYLWHYPIFHWLTSYQTGLSEWPLFALRVAISVATAALSFHLVEMPIRRGAWPHSLRDALVAVVAAAVILAGCLTLASQAATTPYPKPPAAALNLQPVKVLFLGDSMMWTLDFAVSNWAPHYGIKLDNGAIIGCGLVASSSERVHQMDEKRPPPCQLHVDGYFPARRAWRVSVSTFKPNVVVVLAGRWETSDLKINGQWLNINDASFRARITSSLDDIAADAATQHASLVLMTTPCSWDGEMANGAQWDENSPARLRRYNQLIRSDAARLHASVFNLGQLACPTGHLQYFINGYLVRSADGVHFANDAAPFLSPTLFPYLRRLGLATQATN